MPGEIQGQPRFDQAEEVSNILKENGYKDIVVKKDLAMNDRVVYAKKG